MDATSERGPPTSRRSDFRLPEASDAIPRVVVVIPALNVEAWIGDVLAGPREPSLAPRLPGMDRLLAQWDRERDPDIDFSAERPWSAR